MYTGYMEREVQREEESDGKTGWRDGYGSTWNIYDGNNDEEMAGYRIRYRI